MPEIIVIIHLLLPLYKGGTGTHRVCVDMQGCCIKEKNEVSESFCAWTNTPKQALRNGKNAVGKLRHGHVTDLHQVMILV